jgi:hypothetical protein
MSDDLSHIPNTVMVIPDELFVEFTKKLLRNQNAILIHQFDDDEEPYRIWHDEVMRARMINSDEECMVASESAHQKITIRNNPNATPEDKVLLQLLEKGIPFRQAEISVKILVDNLREEGKTLDDVNVMVEVGKKKNKKSRK